MIMMPYGRQSLRANSADGAQPVTGPRWEKPAKNVIDRLQRRITNQSSLWQDTVRFEDLYKETGSGKLSN